MQDVPLVAIEANTKLTFPVQKTNKSRLIGKLRYWRSWLVFGQGMAFVNIIAIDRSNPERALQSMEKAREVMRQSYSFCSDNSGYSD